ncbi:MAG TPA: hypothetical protein VIE66_17695 [Methylocella sp.]
MNSFAGQSQSLLRAELFCTRIVAVWGSLLFLPVSRWALIARKTLGHVDQEFLPLVEIARFGELGHDQLMHRLAYLPMTYLSDVKNHG